MITLAEKKAFVALGSFLAGVFLLSRAFAKKTPTGEVFIGPVTVEKTTYTPADVKSNLLATLERKVMEDLGVDLDLMEPTKRPSPLQVFEVEDAIHQIRDAGQAGRADFLQSLLDAAQTLPEPAISGIVGAKRPGFYNNKTLWNGRPNRTALEAGQRVMYYKGPRRLTGVLVEKHPSGLAWVVDGKEKGGHPRRDVVHLQQIRAVEVAG